MSIIPYNKYTVRDLTNFPQPYVNSTTEVGYFRGTSVGRIPIDKWRSLPAVLNTNNGIANVDASGVRILNAGMYSIKLSLFPTSTQDVSSNISFNFGSRYLFDVSTNEVVNAFGGICLNEMFTYDPFNNPYIPGIISLVADGYSSGNTGSNFVMNPSTYELSYNYNNAGYSGGALYSGICTTEMTFILDSSATIFFNVSTNSSTGITMSNCVFTLQLISSYSLPPRIWNWTQSNALSNSWQSIASSSSGQYLAAVASGTDASGGGIYTSYTYGNTWVKRGTANGLPSPNPTWLSIASSSTGQYLAAGVAAGESDRGGIWTSSDYGVSWNKSDASSFFQWLSIASSSSGQYFFAVAQNGIGIHRSTDYGATWDPLANGLPTVTTSWSSIASSGSGQYLAACINSANVPGGIYTSSNYGDNWIPVNSSRFSWSCIASSIDGKYLAATVFNGKIYTSSNYGDNFIEQTNGLPLTPGWKSITSSSNGQYLAAVSITNGGVFGAIYTSSNYGDNWIKQPPSNTAWKSIASSSDGTRLAAVLNIGGIYTGTYVY